jgi:serine/threonine protein kinase
MHRRDFIYRDLKGENVMIDRHGYCVIIDLGFGTYNYTILLTVLNKMEWMNQQFYVVVAVAVAVAVAIALWYISRTFAIACLLFYSRSIVVSLRPTISNQSI